MERDQILSKEIKPNDIVIPIGFYENCTDSVYLDFVQSEEASWSKLQAGEPAPEIIGFSPEGVELAPESRQQWPPEDGQGVLVARKFRDAYEIAGTIAGDDTILLIQREGISKADLINALILIMPGLKDKI